MKSERPLSASRLALMLFTGLREAWEEMRLNPFKVQMLGPLPMQRLVIYNRIINPIAGWISHSQGLSPNWEVERIVHIPLRRLLDPGNYGRYRLTAGEQNQAQPLVYPREFPCFIHKRRTGEEVLWGATFRIAMDFLERVFNFKMPDLTGTPVRSGSLTVTPFRQVSA
jgi:hypothetical protein